MNKAPQSQCTLHTYSQKTQSKRNLSRISVTRSFLLEQSGQAHFSSPIPSIFEGRVPLCAPPQHRLVVHYLIAACASLAERFCNRKELSRISVTKSFLLHKKGFKQLFLSHKNLWLKSRLKPLSPLVNRHTLTAMQAIWRALNIPLILISLANHDYPFLKSR